MTPDAVAQIYASQIVSGFDIHKPQYMNELFSRYADQGASAFQLLRSLGFEKEVSGDTYGHFEENRIHEVIIVNANVSQPIVGANIVFVISADSLDANNNFYLRLWDQILFPNEVTGSVAAIDVSSPAAPSITVKLNDVTAQFPALTAAQELVIFSDAWSEGSGQPSSAIRGTWEYENDAQIIKETIGATGSEMVNEDWINVTTMGQKIPSYYNLGRQVDIDYRMALKIDGALLWGTRTTNTDLVDAVTGRPIKTTEGAIPYTRRVGNEQSYTSGAFSVSEFDEMDNTLDREGAGNRICGLLGIKLHQDIENSLKTYFADTNIQYAHKAVNDSLFNSDESLGASVNFKYLVKSERTFMFKRMNVFNNPKLYGAVGYTANQLGLFFPINKKKDPVSGNMVESIGTRYRGLGAYKRKMEVWNVGGTGNGLKVTEFDTTNTFQRAHIGAHFRGGNQFVLLEP